MYDGYGRRGGSVFGSFLLGGLIGAVLALLFAPRSGQETREMIAEKADGYWGQAGGLYETGKEKQLKYYNTVVSHSPLPGVNKYMITNYPQFDLGIPDQFRVDIWKQDFAKDVAAWLA